MALKIPKEIFEKLPWLNTIDRFTRTRNNLSESVLSPGQTENFILKTLELLANGGSSGGVILRVAHQVYQMFCHFLPLLVNTPLKSLN